MTTTNSAPGALIDLVADSEQAFAAGLRGQLAWLEKAALAVDAADLGPDGAEAARDFKAALGTLLTFARAAKQKAPDQEALLEVQAVLRTLTGRGQLALYRALSRQLRLLAATPTSQSASCAELAEVFDALASSLQRGTPPPVDVLERFGQLRSSLPAL